MLVMYNSTARSNFQRVLLMLTNAALIGTIPDIH